MADGVFYGAREDGRLVSAAGTHLVSPTEVIGAVGNIFTLPQHRGRGHGTACTAAVCAQLLGQGLTTLPNVSVTNLPAVRLYH